MMIALQNEVDVLTLEDRILERNLCIQAMIAAQARDLALFDEMGGWRAAARRDCADWVSCTLGYSPHDAKALVAAGHASGELLEIGDAFAGGELSVEKMRLLAPVVTAADEGSWVETARASSPAELARRCREARSGQRVGPERDRAQRAQRRLHTWYDEENMFRISGALPSYEGAMVQVAIDRAKQALRAMHAEKHIDLDVDCADDPVHAENADALVWVCTEAVLGEHGSADTRPKPPVQLIVHVDYDVLTGANPDGRGHIEDGPALSTATLRRLGCDATVKTLIERDGVPIASGREKPTVSPEMRLKVRIRDGMCAYPGCAVPATGCEAHHVHHWNQGGPPSFGISSRSAPSITSATMTGCSTSTARSPATSGSCGRTARCSEA